MARINTNPAALLAVVDLARSHRDLQTSIERLATGLRIQTAGDDPGGLMISEQLACEQSSLERAVQNTESAINMLATTEASLDEVQTLLNNILTSLVASTNTGGMTSEEVNASQLQIDSAVESVNRIANSTEFAGINLLDGSLGISSQNVPPSIDTVQAFRAQFPNGQYSQIKYAITQPAASGIVTAKIQNPAGGASINLLGPKGSYTINVAAQATAADLAQAIAAAVNGSTDVTGLQAQWNDANLASDGATVLNTDTTLLNFITAEQGSEFSVDVKFQNVGVIQTGVYDFAAGTSRAIENGSDILGTLNGIAFVGRGNHAILSSNKFDLDISFNDTVVAGENGIFDLLNSGAVFQIGTQINTSQTLNIGISGVNASALGVTNFGGNLFSLQDLSTGGTFSLANGNPTVAMEMVEQAILEISVMRGRLGAFQSNTLESNLASLQVAIENIAQAGSAIRDTDFAAETAAMTRAEILVQAGTSVLATANSLPRIVLQLLGG